MTSILVKLDGVTAPTPTMHRDAAAVFQRVRKEVAAKAGFDFLARCGDIFRSAGFTSTKDGVADRSWHKTGRAFDYDQTSSALVLVSEPRGGKQYFRTYLKCAKQDGSLGVKRTLRDMRGYNVNAWVIDLTAILEAAGFMRIPAWSGWEKNYNRREFWHYQYNPQNLTWDAAMQQLKGATTTASTSSTSSTTSTSIIGLNDRGDAVGEIQTRLVVKKLLTKKEVDRVFGPKTKAAVQAFQKANGLSADGLVGPLTRAKLFA